MGSWRKEDVGGTGVVEAHPFFARRLCEIGGVVEEGGCREFAIVENTSETQSTVRGGGVAENTAETQSTVRTAVCDHGRNLHGKKVVAMLDVRKLNIVLQD